MKLDQLLVVLGSFLALRSNFVSGRPQPQIEYEMLRPDLLPRYKELLQKCQWKKGESGGDNLQTTCPGVQQECTVPIRVPEGVGYMHISRMGPFETTGAFQQVLCVARGHRAPKGSWLIRAVVGPVDPHTNELMEFPPLHIHHLVTKSEDNPVIPDDLNLYIPYLNFLQKKSSTPGFPSGVSDAQCVKEFGGIDCLHTALPSGYGRRVYGTGNHIYLYLHMQDVRSKNSPPISHYVDYGEIYITTPNPLLAPLKPTMHGTIEVIGPNPIPYTYFLTYNTSMYNFATYYIPTRTQMLGNRMHWHSVEGDEAWIVRGSQWDLGIPQELQKPVTMVRGVAPEGTPIAVANEAAIKNLKLRMEKSITTSREAYFTLMKSNDTKRVEAELFAKRSYLTPKEKPSDLLPSKPPEILCKFYGKHEVLTKADIADKAEKTKQFYRSNSPINAVGTLLAIANAAKKDKSHVPFEFPGLSEDLSTIKVSLVNREQQMKNMFDGVLPGAYYRAAVTSSQLGEKAYPHCNTFQVEAGELLTLIHFNVPRTLPAPGEFDSMELVQHQHSIFMSNVFMPDIELL